jgi:ABC-2 type transport system permease protein
MRMTGLRAVARLEWTDVRRSRWLIFCSALYALLAAAFLGIGLRESGVIGFTGMSRVLASLSHALVLVLPLLALAGTALSINRARENGTLELLLSQPVSRDEYFAAITIVRTGVLLVPLTLFVVVLAAAGRGLLDQPVPWQFLGRALAVCGALTWAFVGIGLAIATRVRDLSRAVVYVLGVWALSVALLDFLLVGAMLQWRVPAAVVFTAAACNPVEAARIALLAGARPALDTLGPVGVFLARRLGGRWLLLIGVMWPVAAGTVAWLAARRSFRRGEVV